MLPHATRQGIPLIVDVDVILPDLKVQVRVGFDLLRELGKET